MHSPGIEAAWQALEALRPQQVAALSGAELKDGAWLIKSFCWQYLIQPRRRSIQALQPQGRVLTERLGYFFHHLLLWWLVGAKGLPAEGRWVKPQGLQGGEFFFQGSHALPLGPLGQRFGSDKEGFLRRALQLDAQVLPQGSLAGDAAVKLQVLPGFPVLLLLWLEEPSAPGRLQLLLERKLQYELNLDLIWCGLMLACLLMLS